MNQTRTFLIFALLMVGTLLWMEWGKEQRAPVAADGAVADATVVDPGATIPGAPAVADGTASNVPGAVPAAPQLAPVPGVSATPAPTSAGQVEVRTDVLDLSLNGGVVARADLLRFPQTRDEDSPPVRLFDNSPGTFYAAQDRKSVV